jgi:ABC-2 type transport system permease protein
MNGLSNIVAVARREYTVRVRRRSFLLGTLALLIGVVAIAFAPIIIQAIDQSSQQRIAVHVAAPDLRTDPVTTLSVLMNAATNTGAETGTTTADGKPEFVVSSVPDLDAARRAVIAGDYAAVLEIDRAPTGDLAFTLYTNQNAMGRAAGLIRQASTSIAVADRLDRLGIAPTAQAGLFGPAAFGVSWPDPARTDPTHGTTELVGRDMLAFGMTVLIFMMIILYGTWIAMSVVEEKSSRVMEVILNAATPFQLLSGKVLGVGAVALTQYTALLVAGAAALLAQGAVAGIVLGSSASTSVPEGLTIPLLLLFGLYGTLGFLVYASLYAAAGSLVSRQEDVNSAVMPMTLVSTAGYMVAIYASVGVLDIRAGWVTALSQVPFVSPFMMLSRITSGQVTLPEVLLSIGLLIACAVATLWLAARIYTAGVLLYGQRPSIRAIARLVRSPA